MSAPSLSVPEPLADDGEDITTALETAAIFNAQGDLREAVRWVRRAAEAAGDAGNDLRALALARAVADLNVGASAAPVEPPPASAAPPIHAPGSVAPVAAAHAQAAAPVSVAPAVQSAPGPVPSDRGSVRPSPVVRVEAAPDAPPPPPPLPAAAAAPAPPPLPAAVPEPPPLPPLPAAAQQPPPFPQAAPPFPEDSDEPTIARPSSPPPEVTQPLAAAVAPTNGAPSAVPSHQSPSVGTAPYAPPVAAPPAYAPAAAYGPAAAAASAPAAAPAYPAAPVSTPTASARPYARVNTPEPFTAGVPVAAPAVTNGVPSVFKAVRASVERTAENGVFRVRVLRADEPASEADQEALMVFLDPTADPF